MSALRSAWQSTVGGGPDFTHQALGTRIDPDGLAGYWCDLRHKARVAAAAPDGLPRDGRGRPIHWVVPLAQAALGAWEQRLDGLGGAEERFLALARALLALGRETGGRLAFPVDVAVPKYGLTPGWIGAMGQGQAISVLLRAHALTGEEEWYESARAALGPLPRSRLEGALVLEEYPTGVPSAVLNGWIFAVLGVWELGRAGGDPRAAELFTESTDGLLALLPRYDVGWWSRYSLYPHKRPDLAKPFYQRLHPVMLDALALARPDPRLTTTADRWRAQLTPFAVARAASEKVRFRFGGGRALAA